MNVIAKLKHAVDNLFNEYEFLFINFNVKIIIKDIMNPSVNPVKYNFFLLLVIFSYVSCCCLLRNFLIFLLILSYL